MFKEIYQNSTNVVLNRRKYVDLPVLRLNYTSDSQFIFDEKMDLSDNNTIPISNSTKMTNIGIYKDDVFFILIMNDHQRSIDLRNMDEKSDLTAMMEESGALYKFSG